jgi:hypothetical protein
MLVGLFDRAAPVQLLAFLGVAAVLWGLGMLALHALRARFARRGGVGPVLPVAPYFVTVTTLFALFLGFMAADIWAQKRAALDAATDERAALAALATLATPAALDAPGLAAATRAYRDGVVRDEWGALRNRGPAESVEAALADLAGEAVALARGPAPVPAAARVFGLVDGLAEARSRRLAIGSAAERIGATAWLSVLVLAAFSVVAIAVVHLDRPAAARLTTGLFAAAVAVAFWFLAMHDSPYAGGVRLEPAVLRAAGAPTPG